MHRLSCHRTLPGRRRGSRQVEQQWPRRTGIAAAAQGALAPGATLHCEGASWHSQPSARTHMAECLVVSSQVADVLTCAEERQVSHPSGGCIRPLGTAVVIEHLACERCPSSTVTACMALNETETELALFHSKGRTPKAPASSKPKVGWLCIPVASSNARISAKNAYRCPVLRRRAQVTCAPSPSGQTTATGSHSQHARNSMVPWPFPPLHASRCTHHEHDAIVAPANLHTAFLNANAEHDEAQIDRRVAVFAPGMPS